MEKQFGRTATLCINDMAHRICEKGCDYTQLVRWAWTTLRGKMVKKLQ
jgi:hypothetical protein